MQSPLLFITFIFSFEGVVNHALCYNFLYKYELYMKVQLPNVFDSLKFLDVFFNIKLLKTKFCIWIRNGIQIPNH